MGFLIAKQPIFDKEGRIFAFEVFLRKKENLYEYPKEVPYSRATYITMEMLLEQGLERVGEGKRVMMNMSIDSLMNKSIEALDPRKLIIDIIEPQIPIGDLVYKQILSFVDKHTQQGVLFCLDEGQLSNQKMMSLFDKVKIISINVKELNLDRVEMLKAKGKTLLFSKIERREEYKKVSTIGDLFQGIYLGQPIVLKEYQTAPYLKTTLLKLMSFIHTAQSPKEVADLISTDVGMSTKIIRFANTVCCSSGEEIRSVEQACTTLGLKNIKNFLLVLAMNDYTSVENPELWKKSLRRAIIAQKIARILNPKYESEAHLMGLFSLIDQILSVDKITFLKETNVNQEIIEAYMGKNAALMNILNYAASIEEELENLLSGGNPLENKNLINLEKLTGIDRQELFDIAKFANEAADSIFKV